MDDGIFMILFGVLSLILLGSGYYACVMLNKARRDVEKNDQLR
jgi:hypothetical protein